MILREIMTRDVETIDADAPVSAAAKIMKGKDVGPIPVVEGRRVIGVLTDRDITVRATAEGRDPNKTLVREVMTLGAFSCYEDQEVKEAAKIMREKQIRRLVILNRNEELVGIVSLGDLAVEVHDDKLSGNVLKEVSKKAA